MLAQKWNKNWKFWSDRGSFALVWDVPDTAREIELPHDAMLESPADPDSPNGGNTGYRDGGVYTYVKTLSAPEEYREKTVMLKFEGIYMNAMVYVNEQLAAKCPYGYTGFYVKLNDFLRYGQDNEIRVLVRNNAMTNSRWYSGSGIYRDVYLLVSDTAYIEPESVMVTTESLDETTAVLTVSSSVKNRRFAAADLYLETEIIDPKGNAVAADRIHSVIFEGEIRKHTRRLVVENPLTWSEDSPVLYTCVCRLMEGEKCIDESVDSFGIRSLSLDTLHGLRVNGKSVNLRGACIHHDSGLLGAATYEAAEYRRIKKLKEAGFNAIRMSHHPAAPALLRVCDALGMYVMDETFDMWTRCKSDNDYALFFDKWWEKDVEAMVKKDYNHPSVILYSIGNEIPEIGTDLGASICNKICGKIKSLDTTRYITAGINGVFAAGDVVDRIVADLTAGEDAEAVDEGANVNDFMTIMDTKMDEIVCHPLVSERLEKACASLDIAGYNYMTARYEPDGKDNPNRVIVGSETYPSEIARNWSLVKKLSHVIGDFTWTGWDYIGEAGIGVPSYASVEDGSGTQFPCQLAYCGDFDLIGFRRPASYFREVVFGMRKDPYVTVQNPYHYGEKCIKTAWVISDSHASWTYPGCEGRPVIVEVYSPGDEVELFVNEKSVGRKPAGDAAGYVTEFETVYVPGIILAISYENGVEIGRMDLVTAKGDGSLTIKTEEVTRDGITLIYADIEVTDDDGVICDVVEKKLTASVEGDAVILGFGSGDPKSKYNYITTETETFYGRAQLILKRIGNNPVAITVSSEGQQTRIQQYSK